MWHLISEVGEVYYERVPGFEETTTRETAKWFLELK